MAFEQESSEPTLQFRFDEDVPLKQKWKMMAAPMTVSENVNECFDCNICLDSAHDPVVTLCGHLYCWPCIYKWLQVQSSSLESNEQPKCPVCKTYISNSTLIPLYGRGTSVSTSEAKGTQQDIVIPTRAQALGQAATSLTTQTNQQLPPHPLQLQPDYHHEQYFPQALGSYASVSPSGIGGTTMTSFYSPTVWMFGELVLARFFRNHGNVFTYPNPNSYPHSGSSTPRMSRQELKVDKSLSRVSIFLLCCIVLCLLLF